jgi:hypothetical protein
MSVAARDSYAFCWQFLGLRPCSGVRPRPRRRRSYATLSSSQSPSGVHSTNEQSIQVSWQTHVMQPSGATNSSSLSWLCPQ